jgi:DNA-binding SARP family transcriptional activator
MEAIIPATVRVARATPPTTIGTLSVVGDARRPSCATLQIATLGGTRVLRDHEDIGGPWIEQRTGQLFKLLVTHRGRVVRVEEIIEWLWPEAGPAAVSTVRVTVHALRDILDPDRCPRGVGSLIVSHRGGYRLDVDRIVVDADRFADLVEFGLRADAAGHDAAGTAYLGEAVGLYGGPFLADEAYSDWAVAERERLQGIAAQALEVLSELAEREGDLHAAARWLDRLAAREPYDEDLQRRLLTLCLRRGRRSEAMRRYAVLTARLRRDLNEEPSFQLSTLLAELGA